MPKMTELAIMAAVTVVVMMVAFKTDVGAKFFGLKN